MTARRSILFVTTLASFLTPFMGSAINIALPAMGKDLDMNTISLGWVTTAYLLSAAVFLLPFGRLSDKYGRKKIFMLGIVVFAITAFASALSGTELVLILSRFLNGAGGAMIYATAIAILTSSFPREERGKVLGINVAAVYLGLSLGPTLGGLMTTILGWRSIFALIGVLAALVIPIAATRLESDRKSSVAGKFDISGSLVYGISLALIIYGFPKIPAVTGFALILSGVAGLWIFTEIEKKASDPLLQISAFNGNQVFIYSNLAAFINYSATFALVFLLSFYLQQIKGLSPGKTGLILMAQPVMMTLLSPVAGRLSDRIEPAVLASSGMSLTVIGLGAFALLHPGSSIMYIILLQVVLGLGFALFSSPNTNAVMSSVDPSKYGIASAALGTMRLTGQTMSMGISLMMFALIMGNKGAGLENTAGLMISIRYAFIVFAILCIAGTFFSLKRGNIRTKTN